MRGVFCWGGGNGRGWGGLLFGMLLTERRRLEHFAAMALIGDGVMALVHPAKDATAWKKGPRLWRELMHGLAERPVLTRVIGAAQVAGGVWWALRQSKR